jgi:hypothetical protein
MFVYLQAKSIELHSVALDSIAFLGVLTIISFSFVTQRVGAIAIAMIQRLFYPSLYTHANQFATLKFPICYCDPKSHY